jgi:AraC-like DNA-binding protein
MQDSTTIFQKSPFLPVHIFTSGIYTGMICPAHQHHCWELVYYRSGHVRSQVGKQIYDVKPGTLLITPPGVPHSDTADNGYNNIYLQLELDQIPDWPQHCLDDETLTLGNILIAIVREWHGGKWRSDEMLATLIIQLDIYLQRAQASQQTSIASQTVVAVEHLMELRYAENITIADLAHEVGISVSALRGYFHQLRGIAPLAYLHQIRLQHALGMLRSSTLPLEEIAHLCGYDSASHLSMHVRRHTGKSPGRWRISPMS